MKILPPAYAVGLRRRFLGGVAWNGLAAVFNQGSTFIVNVLLANLFGRYLFGRFAIVQSTFLTVATLAQVALGYAATKYVAEFRAREPKRAGQVIFLCLVLAAASGGLALLLLVACAPVVASRVLHAPALQAPLTLAALAVPFITVSGCASGALAGMERFRTTSAVAVVAGVAYLVFGVLGGRIGGVTGGIAGLVVAYAVQTVTLLFALTRAMREGGHWPRLQEAWSQWGTIFRFAVPAALGSFSALPALWVASALVARQPNGLSETALYSAANSFRVMVLFVPGVINGVGMSLINHERSQREARRLRRAFGLNLLGVGLASLVGVGVITVAGPLALRLYGHTFDAGYSTLLVLLASTIPEAMAMAVYQVIVSGERLWTSLFSIALPRDITLVVLTYALAPRFGALGMAMAYAAAVALALIATVAWSWHVGLGTNHPVRVDYAGQPGQTVRDRNTKL